MKKVYIAGAYTAEVGTKLERHSLAYNSCQICNGEKLFPLAPLFSEFTLYIFCFATLKDHAFVLLEE